jgi:UPF0716 family protein affecting phage T7 exclusion
LEFLRSLDLNRVLLGAGIFVGGVVLSFTLVAIVIVRMPADYFCGDAPHSLLKTTSTWKRKAARVGKNALGVLLVVLGVVLSIPGIPGQGFLTILIGLTLVDFPGKRKLEKRIMRNHTVLAGANAIRRRFGKQPFELDAEHPPLSSKQPQ